MKGITNGSSMGSATVKTGVTVADMMNIPDDVPWDLEQDTILIHGVGPVINNNKPITGVRLFTSTSAMNMLYKIRSSSSDKLSITYAEISGSTVTGNKYFEMTDSNLATAKLYLYDGGGEPDLVRSTAYDGLTAVSFGEAVA